MLWIKIIHTESKKESKFEQTRVVVKPIAFSILSNVKKKNKNNCESRFGQITFDTVEPELKRRLKPNAVIGRGVFFREQLSQSITRNYTV